MQHLVRDVSDPLLSSTKIMKEFGDRGREDPVALKGPLLRSTRTTSRCVSSIMPSIHH